MEKTEKESIIETYQGMFVAVDNRDWEKCLAAMIEEPEVDYSSLNGNPSAKVKATTLIENWKGFLPKFKATMHFISNHLVTVKGEQADAFCYGHALHYLPDASGGDCWEVFGSYDIKLIKTATGWKVSYLRFNLKYQCGNKELPAIVSKM